MWMKLLGMLVVGGLGGCLVTTPGSGTTVRSTSPSGAEGARGEGPSAITVPDLTGLSRAEAEAKLRVAGVTGEITISGADDGKVCSTVPGTGRETRTNLSIDLAFCGGHENVRPMTEGPNLGGLTEDEATKRARAFGFTGRVDMIRAYQEGCKPNTVCEVDPIRWYVGGRLTLIIGAEPPYSAPSD